MQENREKWVKSRPLLRQCDDVFLGTQYTRIYWLISGLGPSHAILIILTRKQTIDFLVCQCYAWPS